MSQWAGHGMTQEDFMHKDECIVLDEDDNIIGHENKFKTHRFVPGQPRGILHRAFSVFLFDGDGKLLLQKRASTKITFPNVWTNTCCSHPLYGHNPTEVDGTEELASGEVPGVKRAAVRKLEHELGIPAGEVPVDKFKFLTRLHYYAADTITHGIDAPWGEHEIDYILFIQLDKRPTMKPHPDEVDDVCWVTQPELHKMMAAPDTLWSPWFRIITQRWLGSWWADLRATLTTDKHVDVRTIHRFDPSPEHRVGAGVTGRVPGQLDGKKKQGGYGKIPIHSESKLSQLSHVGEVVSALYYKAFGTMGSKVVVRNADVDFCNKMLGKVSRSFAAVIRQLPRELCLDILIFYLCLRALDTIEDDMMAFKEDPQVKVRHLETFYEVALQDRNFTMDGVGEADEKVLLQNFDKVVRVFQSLPETSQAVIADITRRMGCGMAEFVAKDLGQGTETVKEYDLYCHYVAGLVGEGLSRLFSATQVESPRVAQELGLANSMGLFLQKTNIIRDYLEDYVDGRAFWPKEVWGQYAKTGQLGELALPKFSDRALACLNHLVTDALELVPECVRYLELIKNPEVFRFCAIPQVMAIATLATVYNNPAVFTGVVKIRKGLAVRMIMDSGDLDGVTRWLHKYAKELAMRVPPHDPSAVKTVTVCRKIMQLTKARTTSIGKITLVLNVVVTLVLLGCVYYLLQRRTEWQQGALLPKLTYTTDVIVLGAVFGCVAYLLGFLLCSTTLASSGSGDLVTNGIAQIDTAGKGKVE